MTPQDLSFEAVLDDLRRMRKGEGISAPRLVASSLLGLRQISHGRDGHDKAARAIEAYNIVRDVVLMNYQDDNVRLAGRALAIGLPRRGNLTYRRNLSVADGYSLTTVRTREEQGLSHLAMLLYQGHLAPGETPEPTRQDPAFRLATFHLEYRLGKGRRAIEWLDTRTLVCNVDLVGDILVKHLYTGTSPVEFEVVSGGHVDVQYKSQGSATGFQTHRVILTTPLKMGEDFTLCVRKVPSPGGEPPQPFAIFVPEQPTERAEIVVSFEDELPYGQLEAIVCMAHSLPLPTSAPTPIRLQGRKAQASFTHLQPGFAYGISWTWPAPHLRE